MAPQPLAINFFPKRFVKETHRRYASLPRDFQHLLTVVDKTNPTDVIGKVNNYEGIRIPVDDAFLPQNLTANIPRKQNDFRRNATR